MKKHILLFLLLTASASAQFPMVAAWQSAAVAPGGWTTPADSAAVDSLKGWYVAVDLADSLGKSAGDTTYIWPNRARWLSPAALGDLYQTTDAQKPVFRGDSNTVVFDGVNDYMFTDTTTIYPQPNTIVIVAKWTKPHPSGSVFPEMFDGRSPTGRHTIYSNGTVVNKWSQFAGANGADPPRIIRGDTTYIFVASFETPAGTIRMNGNTGASANPGTNPMRGLALGANHVETASTYANVSIREVLVYGGVLTAYRLAKLESYLATKYGITLP